jgi:iron-sulfur cluster assembly protein/iron-sulfur cluster insertion protein
VTNFVSITSGDVITVTDTAAAKVAELKALEDQPDLALRVAVRPGGCSGYSYEMFFDSDVNQDDLRTRHGDVEVVVDPASARLLRGAVLDYKNTLTGGGFSVDNPNASRSCGCGQSFS